MSAAIGTKNKMRTRVERREKGSDPVPPYQNTTRVLVHAVPARAAHHLAALPPTLPSIRTVMPRIHVHPPMMSVDSSQYICE